MQNAWMIPASIIAGLLMVGLLIVFIQQLFRRLGEHSSSTSFQLPSKLCSQCGNRVPDIGTFCAVCGYKLG